MNRKNRVYISGPITGIPDYLENFEKVEKELTKAGYSVINPAKLNANMPDGIEYEEFLRACMDQKTLLCDEHLVYAFNFFDKDNTGRISVDKIKANFIDSTVSEEVFKSIFNEIDTNQDGEIDIGEFKDMMFGV